MKTITLCRAEPITSNMPVDSVSIVIGDKIPERKSDGSQQSFDEIGNFYEKQADLLASALFNSLPQGTVDRLLIHLMKHKLSLYMGTTNS